MQVESNIPITQLSEDITEFLGTPGILNLYTYPSETLVGVNLKEIVAVEITRDDKLRFLKEEDKRFFRKYFAIKATPQGLNIKNPDNSIPFAARLLKIYQGELYYRTWKA